MNAKEIIEEYLNANGYNGLCDPDGECGCAVNDLCPCDNLLDCVPAYKRICTDCSFKNDCTIKEEVIPDNGCFYAAIPSHNKPMPKPCEECMYSFKKLAFIGSMKCRLCIYSDFEHINYFERPASA